MLHAGYILRTTCGGRVDHACRRPPRVAVRAKLMCMYHNVGFILSLLCRKSGGGGAGTGRAA